MSEQPERTSPPPPLPVRVIGKALTRMVACAPWTWPLMRRWRPSAAVNSPRLRFPVVVSLGGSHLLGDRLFAALVSRAA